MSQSQKKYFLYGNRICLSAIPEFRAHCSLSIFLWKLVVVISLTLYNMHPILSYWGLWKVTLRINCKLKQFSCNRFYPSVAGSSSPLALPGILHQAPTACLTSSHHETEFLFCNRETALGNLPRNFLKEIGFLWPESLRLMSSRLTLNILSLYWIIFILFGAPQKHVHHDVDRKINPIRQMFGLVIRNC